MQTCSHHCAPAGLKRRAMLLPHTRQLPRQKLQNGRPSFLNLRLYATTRTSEAYHSHRKLCCELPTAEWVPMYEVSMQLELVDDQSAPETQKAFSNRVARIRDLPLRSPRKNGNYYSATHITSVVEEQFEFTGMKAKGFCVDESDLTTSR